LTGVTAMSLAVYFLEHSVEYWQQTCHFPTW